MRFPLWGDLLTGYNNLVYTYDEIGNPTGDTLRSYTWEHGRQLETLTLMGNTWDYTYDANGLRTKRSSDSVTYEYIYSGDKLVQVIATDHTTTPETVSVVEYAYDAAGQPLTMTLGNDVYYYVLNIQGDVMGLVDSSGTLMITYYYEGYGECYSLSNTSDKAPLMSANNHLLYRGYVVDKGTGLYYLQSRYYDPNVGRFINADSLVSTGQGVLGYNMFAYCGNNPVNSHDPSGMCGYSVYMGGSVGSAGCYRCKNNQNYIDDQNDETIAKKRLGIANVGHAGCGPIAVYNATVTMGMNVTFDEVLDYYNSNALRMDVFGLAGTSVNLISGFFEERGYDVICAYNMDSIDAVSPLADASILYYKFPRTYLGVNAYGAHFTEYTYLGNGYYAHNVSSGNNFTVPSIFAGKNSRYDVVGIFIFEPLGG